MRLSFEILQATRGIRYSIREFLGVKRNLADIILIIIEFFLSWDF